MTNSIATAVAQGFVSDLPTFALQLARHMEQCGKGRLTPTDQELPFRLVYDTAYSDKIRELLAARDHIVGLNSDQALAEAQDKYEAKIAAYDLETADIEAARLRLFAMAEKLNAWVGAPDGIVGFARGVLNEAHYKYVGRRRPQKPEHPQTADAFWHSELIAIDLEIAKYMELDSEEREQTLGCNDWLAQLHQSLAEVEG